MEHRARAFVQFAGVAAGVAGYMNASSAPERGPYACGSVPRYAVV